MEISRSKPTPHPQLIDTLFAFRSKVSQIFSDVLGLHEIRHIAVSRINISQQIQIFSSTLAMEFNLFTSNLWRFDKTYNPSWFRLCTQSNWQALYDPMRYDELYYLKQIKHQYPIGQSMAALSNRDFFIYSFASNRACKHTLELFINQYDDFYKIGQYCTNLLLPIFLNSETVLSPYTGSI